MWNFCQNILLSIVMNVGWRQLFLFIFQVLILIFERTLHPLSCTGTSQEGWEMQISSIRLATSCKWAALLRTKFLTNGKFFIKVSDCGVMMVEPSCLLFNLRLLSERCLSFSWCSTSNNSAEIFRVARRREFWFNKFFFLSYVRTSIFLAGKLKWNWDSVIVRCVISSAE